MGILPLSIIVLCYAWGCLDLAMKGRYPEALMCFAWGLGSAAFIWSLARNA